MVVFTLCSSGSSYFDCELPSTVSFDKGAQARITQLVFSKAPIFESRVIGVSVTNCRGQIVNSKSSSCLAIFSVGRTSKIYSPESGGEYYEIKEKELRRLSARLVRTICGFFPQLLLVVCLTGPT